MIAVIVVSFLIALGGTTLAMTAIVAILGLTAAFERIYAHFS